jgi:hypothetical protein
MKTIATGLGMLTAMLFLSSGNLPADEKNEAKELFEKMEKALVDADTIQVTTKGKFSFPGEDGALNSTLLIAQGNKARMDITIIPPKEKGKPIEMSVISNGTKQRSSSPALAEAKEEDTPKFLRDDLVYTLSRIGLAPAFMQTKKRDESKRIKDTILVSDFQLDQKRDVIDGTEVQGITYKVVMPSSKEKIEMQLYIDVKTQLPVLRVCSAFGNLKEEYKYKLNEKIGPENFELPKK